MKKFLLTALLLAAGSSALAVGAPAGSTISNTATLELNDGVATRTETSNTVNVNVQQVYAVLVTPNGTTAAPGQTVTVQPGSTGILNYVVTNTGNGTDSITLAAVTANATAQGANILGAYLDNPTTGTVGSYDAGDTLVTSLVSVPADGSRTIFVRYSVPAGSTGGSASGSAHQLNLTATSVGDTSKTDTNNVGQITVGRTIDLTLASTQTKTVAAGGSVSFTDTLTNTGNTPLTAAELTTSTAVATTRGGTAIADTAFTTSYSVTGPGGTFSGPALDALIDSATGSGLASGSALTITVTVTPATTTLDASQVALTFKAFSPTTGTGIVNNAPDGDVQATITNTAVLQRGVGTVTKTVAKCTSSTVCPARASAGTADVSALPGEFVVYYLEAQNSGSGTLTNVRLSDALPANFVITQVGATTSLSGTLKFSKDGATWNADVTTLGTLTGGSDRLYVAVENGGTTTTIDAGDTFAAGTLRLKIVGYVRDGATTGGTPARSDTGL